MSAEPEEIETPVTITPVKTDAVEDLIASLDSEVFSSELEEHPFKIKGKEGVVEYTIRELDGEQRGNYVNLQASMAKFGPDGKIAGMKYNKDLEVKLAAMSLIGPDGKLMPESFVSKLPGKLLKKITSIAARISGLDDKAEERAKNA